MSTILSMRYGRRYCQESSDEWNVFGFAELIAKVGPPSHTRLDRLIETVIKLSLIKRMRRPLFHTFQVVLFGFLISQSMGEKDDHAKEQNSLK